MKRVRTIILIANDDNTDTMILRNFKGLGSEMELKRVRAHLSTHVVPSLYAAKDKFSADPFVLRSEHQIELDLHAETLPDSVGVIYEIYEPKADIRNLTDDELIAELGKRGRLGEERWIKLQDK